MSQITTTTRRRMTCRVCYSPALTELLSLGEQFVSDFVPKDQIQQGDLVPIELVLCQHCGLVQLRHTAPQQMLYCDYYWYRSGVNEAMREALRDVAERAENLMHLQPGDVVLDIGSNDGTLLRSYTIPGLLTVGVEPARNLMQEGSQGVSCFIQDMWNFSAYKEKVGRSAKVITALGMFYDLEDPNQFVGDMAKALDKDGLIIAQLMCVQNMLSTNDVGNLAHEHLEFYSFASLEYLFQKHGLEIFDIEINSVNGQSYRLYIRHILPTSPTPVAARQRVETVRAAEKGLETQKPYHDFFGRIQHTKEQVVSFIQQEVSRGKRVWVYGASTKGNVILQYYGLDHKLIEGASERSPEKWGKYTIGTGIPIYSELQARLANPNYFLVLPYTFLDQFMQREQRWRDGGGKFLVPLPEFRMT